MSDIKLVLLSCCAPCSAGAIRQLAGGADLPLQNGETVRISDGIVLFYNPNIFPESEYQKRLSEQTKLCESLDVKYFIGQYDHDNWLECAHGLEGTPEQGARCAQCFKMRLSFGAKWAAANGYNALATVFGVSKHKSQAQVDAAAIKIISQKNNLQYLQIDFSESVRIAENKRHDFYRQNYCGCEFSAKPKTTRN